MCLFALCFVLQINAQVIRKSNDFPPPWRSGDMPKVDTQTYYLKEFQGEGKTLTEARENAILGLISDIAQNKGVTVTGSQLSEIKAQSVQGKYSENEKTTSTYKIESEGFYASFELMDVYWEESRVGGRSEFYCWALFEVALDPNTKKFDKIQFSTNYGILPVLKSAIVPGWGQFSKMQKVKGLSIFGGEAALLGFGLVAENMRVDLITKMNNSRDVAFKKQCLDLANSWENGRNISFATAGALYVYNLIDAVVSKGAKRYIYGNKVSLIPQYDQNSVGISLVCNLK